MKKVLLGTLFGFALFLAGLYVGYLAILSIREGANPLFILGAVALCGAGMFALYKSGRMDTFKSKFAPIKGPDEKNTPNVLQRNNEIVKEWSETADNREKLKVLEAAERAKQEE